MIRNPGASVLEQSGLSTKSLTVFWRFVVANLQLFLLAWLVHRYSVEESLMLPRFMTLLVPAAILHSLIPFRFQPIFFIGLTGVASVWLFGIIPAIFFLIIVSFLFAILHLPIHRYAKVPLTVLSGAGLAFIWVTPDITLPGEHLIIPVIGSIFMFRAAAYLYDRSHQKSQAPVAQQLSYFLMLPNLAFPLFPVVDYKVFCKSFNAGKRISVYQKGVRWMIRGFFHLMLYRIIYSYLQPDLTQVNDLLSLALFAFTSYLLILRLSGLFHLAAGVLALFGYDLPRVFHNYFLASGFSDLWRRINIYWRDYILKLFYYPIYFRLRSRGRTSGMIITILIVFIITWLLHSYQWFWLKGAFPLRVVDAIFWSVFGICVAANAWLQQKRAGNPASKRKPGSMATFSRALQVTGMLLFMSFLWTFWNSPTLSAWTSLMALIPEARPMEWMRLLGWILTGVITLSIGFSLFKSPRIQRFLEPADSGSAAIGWGITTLLCFSLLAFPPLQGKLETYFGTRLNLLYDFTLNTTDASLQIDAYYEDILVPNPLITQVAKDQQRPADWVPFRETGIPYFTNDWLHLALHPDASGNFKGAPFTTNQWGMRDRSYAKEKPENTFRVCIMGGSYVMGSGVADDEVFDEVCERELNRTSNGELSYEILNFGSAGHHLLHHIYRFQKEAIPFSPDLTALVSHGVDFEKFYGTITEYPLAEDGFIWKFCGSVLEDFGFSPGRSPDLRFAVQLELGKALADLCLKEFSRLCSEHNIRPMVIYWPRTRGNTLPADKKLFFAMAKKHGIIIADLGEAYRGYDGGQLSVASFDNHPNALGHQLIGNHLCQFLQTDPRIQQLIETTAN